VHSPVAEAAAIARDAASGERELEGAAE
jgi:hypothetical protein